MRTIQMSQASSKAASSAIKPSGACVSRRGALGGCTSAALLAAMAADKRAAHAYGTGFPGYDVNLDARKRAQDRAKAEMEAEKAKAKAFKEAKKREAETKAAAAAAAAASASVEQ